MIHYLNVCDIQGGNVPPVDIITFGSPCQDLSVAGKRAGLKHEGKGDEETTRSGLFMEAVRIIKEMREETNGKYPTFALWENVPGAFSSNKGEDFRIVLEELAKISDPSVSVPAPPKGKWTTSGSMDGDGWSLAWRTVDAQYHGVAQRRRRILLVADFAGQRAGEISFKCEGLPGYPSESGEARQTAPADAQGSTGADDRAIRFDGYNGDLTGGVSSTLGVNCGMSTGRNGVLERGRGLDDVIHIDRESWSSGIGFNRTPGITEDGVSSTLQTKGPGAVCYALQGSMVGRKDENEGGPNTTTPILLVQDEKKNYFDAELEVTVRKYPVDIEKLKTLMEPIGVDLYNQTTTGDKSITIRAKADNEHLPIVMEPVQYQDNIGTLCATDYKWVQQQQVGENKLIVERGPGATCTRYIVRRLTPTECARLQGFPDWWGHVSKKDDFTEDEFNFWNDVYVTHQLIVNGKEVQPKTKPQLLTWYNKLWTDSAEYKMWGNGVALPCVRVPIHNMAKHGAKTLASLFDGSGGFPLAGVLEGITPVWASEIEPYPIAVTVERFPEPEDDWMD